MNHDQGPVASDAAGPNGDEESAARPSANPSNPFENLRATTVIPWMIVGTLILVGVFHVFALLTPLGAGDPQASEVIFGFAIYGALASWIVWACCRSGIPLRRLLGALPGGYNWLSWTRLAALLAVTIGFSYSSWFLFAHVLSIAAPGVLEFLIEALWPESDPGTGYRLAMAVIAVILAPILEEGFFRGILVNRWGSRWGLPTALIASSIAFGVLHANPVGIGLVGLIAALLYLQTRTLIVPILFHAANNLVATVWDQLAGDAGPLNVAAEIQELREGILFGIGLAAITLPILIWYIRRNWPARDAALPYDATE
ncbi:MAG: CPBP family intramembrane metalloprotease [Gemmatimonadetes bacterium]|nr:CPBP family intramembrane metalloprotease [Gemmatimonadota bacterium]MYG34490.1 CPBP family intramembrane metalloprotease [Gemmatimonadota bacterium]